MADPIGYAVKGMGLWLLAYWDYWFESHQCHGCLSPGSVVCCQVEFSAAGQLLVQRNQTECDVSECYNETSIMKWPWPSRDCRAMGENSSISDFH
jgi:hypothetical protein